MLKERKGAKMLVGSAYKIFSRGFQKKKKTFLVKCHVLEIIRHAALFYVVHVIH